MKRTWTVHRAVILACALMLATGVGSVMANGQAQAAATGPQRLNMGAGWVTGVYYPLAGAMSRIAHLHMENISLTVESSGASVVNSNLIGRGDLDMAIVQNDVAYYAYNGLLRDDFQRNPVQNMRGLFTLYPEPVQLVARADAGIRTPSDLAGKRVAVGPLGSGAEVNALQVLEAAGLSEADLAAAERLEAGEAADYLRDGRVDAAFFTVGIGASVIADLAVGQRIMIVPIDGEYAQRLLSMEDFYAHATIPANTYSGVEEANTIAVVSMVVARAELSEEIVYQFVSKVFEHVDIIHSAHQAGRMVTLETALDGMPIELHPGAQRFFTEQGMR